MRFCLKIGELSGDFTATNIMPVNSNKAPGMNSKRASRISAKRLINLDMSNSS